MSNINSISSLNSNGNNNAPSQHLLQQIQKVHIYDRDVKHFLECVNRKLEDLRLRLNEPIVPLTNEAILHLSTELQPLYRALIIYNLDEFVARNLETALWSDCFKTPLTRYGRTDKNLFTLMIESGVGYYFALIQDIGVHFDISFITNSPSATKLYCTSPNMMNSHFIKPTKSSIYFIIQNCLLHVGDLLRYRGTSYPEAIKMYEKSAAVCPSNGYPYHQMGLTQLLMTTTCGEDENVMDGFLSCLYYFARSLSVSNRFLPAFQSIESLIKSKVEPEPKKPAKPLELMLRHFMVSIYENKKAVNLFQQMSAVVQNQQVNASTLVKMIVIALWNNWRNQFSNGSLEIVACIINSVVGATKSATAGEAQMQYSSLLPHLKLLMEWMNWHQENPTMLYLFSLLDRPALVALLNQLKSSDQFSQSPPNSWVLEAILPEEKKLIGFIPMDYSMCFNAGSTGGAIDPPRNNNNGSSQPQSQSRQHAMTGHLLSEDKDIALSFNLRIHRVVSVALKLASNRNCFLFDGANFQEHSNGSPKPGSGLNSGAVPQTHLQPSRRNVALQSIFRSTNTATLIESLSENNPNIQSGSTQVSPTSCASTFASAGTPGNNNNTNNLIMSPGSTGSLGSNLTTSHDFFRSIWTPDTENTDSKWY